MNTNTTENRKNSRKSLPKMRELKNTSNKILGGAASYSAASYGAASYGAASYGAAGGDDKTATKIGL